MAERLVSLGLDVGTTSTQMIFSELTIENRAGAFSVPEMEIGSRKILYRSDVHFTPLLEGDLVDAEALGRIVDREYALAGLTREMVDTGAIIITGETSRKENARAVLSQLSGYAGDFVVAAAGPDLESVLAAKGAGAVAYSERTGKRVLHMDIGGGTSNLALIADGRIIATGCLNVGGRLLKFDRMGTVTYVSPVLKGLCAFRVDDCVTPESLRPLADTLTQALEMAAGLRTPTPLLQRLTSAEIGALPPSLTGGAGEDTVISFSGGVADCVRREVPWLEYGDMGPVLGRAILESRLCAGGYILGEETIRATVIGAGCHSAQLSGSTVFHRGIRFPLKNLPVIPVPPEQMGAGMEDFLRASLARQEEPAVLALSGEKALTYAGVAALADVIAGAAGKQPVLVCTEGDMAKALGQALAIRLEKDVPILCIDRIRLGPESYLDVGAPVGPAFPVVVKTLILER